MVDFNYVYNKYYNYIRTIVSNMISDDPDDITQLAFIKLSQCTYAEHEGIAREFLKTTAKRMCIDYIKAKKIRRQFNAELNEHDEPSNEQEHRDAEQEEFKEQIVNFIHKKIAELPDNCRNVFELYYFKNMKAKQIAKELKITPNTVWSHLHRARNTLRMDGLFKRSAM